MYNISEVKSLTFYASSPYCRIAKSFLLQKKSKQCLTERIKSMIIFSDIKKELKAGKVIFGIKKILISRWKSFEEVFLSFRYICISISRAMTVARDI